MTRGPFDAFGLSLLLALLILCASVLVVDFLRESRKTRQGRRLTMIDVIRNDSDGPNR